MPLRHEGLTACRVESMKKALQCLAPKRRISRHARCPVPQAGAQTGDTGLSETCEHLPRLCLLRGVAFGDHLVEKLPSAIMVADLLVGLGKM